MTSDHHSWFEDFSEGKETIWMTAQEYDAFLERVNQPPSHNEGLERLFATTSPWD